MRTFVPRTDPVTYEVLRHRLWQINDEQGRTILNVSGSPVASEANDFNAGIANADGELISVGPYIVVHMVALSLVIRSALAMFGGKEGIEPGAMFLVNDPWLGAVHQNDVCVIAPVHLDGRLIAWTGSVIHEVDVGGPVAGSWNPAATDTFQEAPRYRLLKIVREGRVQPEVLDTYLTNSRTPDLVEMDLRAQIAAANVAKERLVATCRRWGIERVLDTMADVLDHSEALLRRKLGEIPDGRWDAEGYLDHDGREDKIYTCRLSLRKEGERLVFDYRGSDPQAAAFINSPRTGVLGGTFVALLPYLCSDIPWNGGVLRAVEVLADEGSLHNARYPAAVSSGVVNACWQVSNTASLALARMLACSERHRHELMAVWSGSTFVFNLFGSDQRGRPFGTMILNSPLQGDGARYFADGHDVGGQLMAPRPAAPNVETVEALYPLLYLYRRRAMDSGGPGRYRGGVSAESAIAPHGTSELSVRVTTFGADQSCTEGVAGGYPGGGSNPLVVRGSDALERLRAGRPVASFRDLAGAFEALPPKHTFDLRAGDVFIGVPHGGGGFGDPLEREPAAVARDVVERCVSRARAGETYGVVLRGEGAALRADDEATAALRDALRATRLREARAPSAAWRLPAAAPAGTIGPDATDGGAPAIRLSESLRDIGGIVACASCGAPIAPSGADPTAGLAVRVRALGAASPWVAMRWNGESRRFILVERLCPGCGRLIETTQRRTGEIAPSLGGALAPAR